MQNLNQQEVQQYLQGVLKQSESDPTSLTKDERRLCAKYRSEAMRLNQINADISQMRDQIRQAEARLKSLELQAADSQGRANSYLDYMASLKFENDAPPPPMPPPDHPSPKTPGAAAAQPPEEKKHSKKGQQRTAEEKAA